MTKVCSSALVMTVIGSSNTPSSPREESTLMAYSGSIRQRSDMNPWIFLMPRSVYSPLVHMSHSPTAQFAHGIGSGRRTIPTSRSPFLNELLDPWVNHAAEGFMSQDKPPLAGGRPTVLPFDDL